MDFNSIKNEASYISRTAVSDVGTLIASSFTTPRTAEEEQDLSIKITVSGLRALGALGMAITTISAVSALPALLLTGAVLKMSLIALGFVLSKDAFQMGDNLSKLRNSITTQMLVGFKAAFSDEAIPNAITQDTYFKNLYKHFMMQAIKA
ncbi:MAG: hypothetical protein H0W88_08285 [Parachlamydiaceae bacterium]|nr:hypothetical protein [Parachlamydiaceae bacterium]